RGSEPKREKRCAEVAWVGLESNTVCGQKTNTFLLLRPITDNLVVLIKLTSFELVVVSGRFSVRNRLHFRLGVTKVPASRGLGQLRRGAAKTTSLPSFTPAHEHP